MILNFNSLVNSGLGSDLERYSWTQTLYDVSVNIKVPPETTKKNIICEMTQEHIFLKIDFEEKPIFDVFLFLSFLWPSMIPHVHNIIILYFNLGHFSCKCRSWWILLVHWYMILSFIHHSQSDSILLHSLDEENGVKYIKLFLAKWRHSSWWNCVTIDEPCIDLSKLEPPPSKLYEIDENLQGDVSKYLVFHSLTLSID